LLKRFIQSFFFGNYFYGICVVVLSIESALQQGASLNSVAYYLAIFCSSILYYTYAYVDNRTLNANNQRSDWYLFNKKLVIVSQVCITALFIVSVSFLIKDCWDKKLKISIYNFLLLLVFPLIAILYYGIQTPINKFNLRDTGWLKPFIIGFVWAGVVSVYPMLFNSIVNGTELTFTLYKVLLLVKNILYISILCIMFDIKDYTADHNRQLKTFVVSVGLRNTIYRVLFPLSIVGLSTVWLVAFSNHFSVRAIILNTIPFVLLMTVAVSMQRRKPILFYLIIIDGLMLVKAICGIMGVLLDKYC